MNIKKRNPENNSKNVMNFAQNSEYQNYDANSENIKRQIEGNKQTIS